jgi:hypothetical protein
VTSDERIAKLLLTLSVNAPTLDTVQIGGFLQDLRKQILSEERDRIGDLIGVYERRVIASKGRIWQSELNELRDGVDVGVQFLVQPN